MKIAIRKEKKNMIIKTPKWVFDFGFLCVCVQMNGNWKLNAFAEEKWNCVPGVTVKWLHCTTTEFSFFHFSNKNIPNLNWKENGNFAYAWVNETFIFRISYPLFYSLFLNSFFSTTFFRFKKCFSLLIQKCWFSKNNIFVFLCQIQVDWCWSNALEMMHYIFLCVLLVACRLLLFCSSFYTMSIPTEYNKHRNVARIELT